MSKNSNRGDSYAYRQGNTKDETSPDVLEQAAQPELAEEVQEEVSEVTPVGADAPAEPSGVIGEPSQSVPALQHPQLKANPVMHPVESQLVSLSQSLNPALPVEGRWQYTLFQLIRNTIESQQGDEFDKQWGIILNFFEKAKGTAFSDMYILRPSEDWAGSESDFATYRRFIHVISETSAIATRRQNAARINLTLATDGLSEEGRNRLIGYYG